MEIELDAVEARVLGCLIEKELTTPDYYPLTLNALKAACNQKSNRSPVMELDDKEVSSALEELRYKHLAWHVSAAGSRVPKFRHNLTHLAEFTPRETAVLCELLLRGPQTVGELRTHASRMYEFEDVGEAETAVRELGEWEDGPFVAQLPREAGKRESRYIHLLCGEVDVEALAAKDGETAGVPVFSRREERLEALEAGLDALRSEVAELREAFATFRRQFE